MLTHGGRLRQATSQYQRPLSQWLDLSTGINPNHYPIGEVPADAWQRLPEDDDPLQQAARHYYGCSSLLPVAGSQAAIQALPYLRPRCRVGVPRIGYAEHAHRWQQAGHSLCRLDDRDIEPRLDRLDVLILINPNNPSGTCYPPEQLLGWHQRLASRGGWLIVDEAFIDATPPLALPAPEHRPGLIVLRSVGKFFGLAGARAGFVLAEPTLLAALAERLGPWPLSGPSRWLCQQALADQHWQQQTRAKLKRDAARLRQLLSATLGLEAQGTALFQTLATPAAECLYQQLARQGILVRLFKPEQRVRFGLPATEPQWQRLRQALENCRIPHSDTPYHATPELHHD